MNEKGVNHRNAASIAKARETGHLVFVNSGRARSYIDAAMLENAGIAVAMGNASDEVQCIADFISIKKCEDGGVGFAIEKLVLSEGKSMFRLFADF